MLLVSCNVVDIFFGGCSARRDGSARHGGSGCDDGA